MRAEQVTYEWLQLAYPRITEHYAADDLVKLRKDLMAERREFAVDLSLMRRQMLRVLADEHGYPQQALVEEGFELFYRLRHDVEFYPDVFTVLDRLKPGFRMGSISNGNASAGLTPLADYFEVYLNAADVMARKPDRKIFQEFCRRMEVSPEQCVYVGDDPHNDVAGARDAGLRTVWVNRENRQWDHDLASADAEVGDLHQLLKLLG